MKKTLVLTIGFFILAACVSTSAVRIGGDQKLPPVLWKDVAVYRSADQVPGPYREVALLIASGDSLLTTEGEMWKSLQKKAGKLGANGLILDATTEPKDGSKIVSALLWGGGPDRKGKAIAIFILPPEK
ncbi:MAG: hypothetical protein A2162_02295 [Deltaproteobacteria bacterium RBG_13_52_11b]|nr:MAG: hypothetical protein A2162_02295 [Deltaproteobacteria bacterium RBG_13_52_11b]